MRTLVAALLALVLLAAAAVPHVHADLQASSGGDGCALCTVRHAGPVPTAVPDVAPIVHVEGEVAGTPGLPPVVGAPLGAVPGQSPPAAA